MTVCVTVVKPVAFLDKNRLRNQNGENRIMDPNTKSTKGQHLNTEYHKKYILSILYINNNAE